MPRTHAWAHSRLASSGLAVRHEIVKLLSNSAEDDVLSQQWGPARASMWPRDESPIHRLELCHRPVCIVGASEVLCGKGERLASPRILQQF